MIIYHVYVYIYLYIHDIMHTMWHEFFLPDFSAHKGSMGCHMAGERVVGAAYEGCGVEEWSKSTSTWTACHRKPCDWYCMEGGQHGDQRDVLVTTSHLGGNGCFPADIDLWWYVLTSHIVYSSMERVHWYFWKCSCQNSSYKRWVTLLLHKLQQVLYSV